MFYDDQERLGDDGGGSGDGQQRGTEPREESNESTAERDSDQSGEHALGGKGEEFL